MTEKPISNEIIKVGKYKGQPLEVLINDPEYAKWLTDQAWFRQGHSAHYNIIINNFGVPNDTPEHNAMQAKFLKRDLLVNLCQFVLKTPRKIEMTFSRPVFEDDGWDVTFSAQLARFSWIGSEQGQNMDCSLEPREVKGKSISYFEWFPPEKDRTDKLFFSRLSMDRHFFFLELKPTLGDDYPTVLRQIKRIQRKGGKTLLIVERFNVSSVSLDDVTEIFARDDIMLILLSDIT